MNLTLNSSDLLPAYKLTPRKNITFKCFHPDVQMVILAAGQANFFEDRPGQQVGAFRVIASPPLYDGKYLQFDLTFMWLERLIKFGIPDELIGVVKAVQAAMFGQVVKRLLKHIAELFQAIQAEAEQLEMSSSPTNPEETNG